MKNWQAAAKDATAALEIDHNDAEAYTARAQACCQNGSFGQAATDFESAFFFAPSDENQENLQRCLRALYRASLEQTTGEEERESSHLDIENYQPDNDGTFAYPTLTATYPSTIQMFATALWGGSGVAHTESNPINPGTRDKFDMKHQDIKIVKPLGSGNFGVVNLGTIVSTGASVTVKQCKEAGHQERFLEEALVMKDLDHRNVAKLIGVVSTAPTMIIMELCKETLLLYLQTQGRLCDVSTLIRLSSEAAQGMRYLHEKKIIHRDLAARNCLISSNEDCTVKVFNFGMSRVAKGKDESYKLNAGEGQIPIKWTAPEALVHKICVLASDVWSYGILLWEIFSCGKTPYSGLMNAEVQELVCNYEYRMSPPKGTPHRMGKLMAECWQLNVQDRPMMVDIVACFE